jgi:sugar/nucleoside kinase (ribokinase family)
MPRQALLVAGPLCLDDLPEQQGLLGGGGGYAAMGAGPITPTQLWARGGDAITPNLRAIFTKRRIDLAGVTWEGPTARWSPTGFSHSGGALPAIEPTEAEELGAVLLIDLAPADGRRALSVVSRLPKAETRPLLIAPRPADCAADHDYLKECAAAADVLILPAAMAASMEGDALSDPLALAGRIRALGAKCVVLTRGAFGGLVSYQQKATTWAALPVEVVEPTGIGSSFAGALAAWCATQGHADFSTIKRGLAMASAVASITAQGVGPRKLLTAESKEYVERFNKLRRTNKF